MLHPLSHHPIIMNTTTMNNHTNTTHQPTLRRAFRLLGLPLGLAIAALSAQAATIEPTTWYSSGPADTPVEGGGLQFDTKTSSGIQNILTYFDPVSLSAPGDSLNLSLTFSAKIHYAATGTPFRFALYDSGGKQISDNGLGQNNSAFNAYRGYRVGVGIKESSSDNAFELRPRSANETALGGGTSHPAALGGYTGATSSNLASDTLYNASYTITRTDANTLAISISITGGALSDYNGSWSVSSTSDPFYTTFDTAAIMMNSNGLFDSLTLYNVSITSTSSIPEPATVALLLGGATLGFVGWRRRRL